MLMCNFCGNEILSPHAKRFCDRSCAAKFNNALRKARKHCENCDKVLTHNRNRFCDKACWSLYEVREITGARITNGEVHERSTLRRYLIACNGHQCSSCMLTTWQEVPIPLELDHIDGDASNNNLANLRVLCPNCHALTTTWKGRNAGNGRKSRGLTLS